MQAAASQARGDALYGMMGIFKQEPQHKARSHRGHACCCNHMHSVHAYQWNITMYMRCRLRLAGQGLCQDLPFKVHPHWSLHQTHQKGPSRLKGLQGLL